MNMNMPSFESMVSEILKEYPNVDTSKLCKMNPWYSCITCSNVECTHYDKPNHSCQHHNFREELSK